MRFSLTGSPDLSALKSWNMQHTWTWRRTKIPFLRQTGARASPGDRPNRYDPGSRRVGSTDGRRCQPSCGSAVVFTVASGVAGGRSGARVPRRKPLRISRIRPEQPPNTDPPATRLFANARSEQGIGEGVEIVRPWQIPMRRVLTPVQ